MDRPAVHAHMHIVFVYLVASVSATCSNDCTVSTATSNSYCSDGGAGSEHSSCPLGTVGMWRLNPQRAREAVCVAA
jgi:hypothetical protein